MSKVKRPEHLEWMRGQMEGEARAVTKHLQLAKEASERKQALERGYGDARYAADLRDLVIARFGRCPPVEHFNGGQCRIWFGSEWHYRDNHNTAQQVGIYGFSELDCLEKLVAFMETEKHLERGSGYSCEECRKFDHDY